MSDDHSLASMKKDFLVRPVRGEREGLVRGLYSRDQRVLGGCSAVLAGRGSSKGGEDGTRCQEYKARDERDGGHICDS